MERLSALDASFLYLEGPRTPMHISSLAIYDGPPPPDRELKTMLERRLSLVPRFRQKLASTPLAMHRPVWIDDEAFDIDAHLQHVALFEPTEEALMTLVSRILAQQLPRDRPLWEMWLITGLKYDRFAVLSKTHHCLFDGISGIDIHAVLLDDSPEVADEPEVEPFVARPEPSGLGLFTRAIRDRIDDAVSSARSMADAARDPRAAIERATGLVRDVTSFASSLASSAPESPMNERIGSRRRYSVVRGSLQDAKDLRHTLGASVNDVVLASVAGAIRAWQHHRDIDFQDVRAMVPVSIRNENDPSGGNRVAMVVIDLPVSDKTALMRLDRVHSAMERAKTSGHIEAGEAITRMSAFMPPSGIAALTMAQSYVTPFNLLVTNIPGPQMPLYLLGRKLIELFPQAPLAANQGLAIAALSYDGKLGFGLLADHDAVPDVEVISHGIERSLDELVDEGALDTAPREPSLSEVAEMTGVR